MFRLFTLLLTLVVAVPATAQAYYRISDRTPFVTTVVGKDLKIALYRLTLNVTANGSINGRPAALDLVRLWSWEVRSFCPHMAWSGYPI